MYKTSTYFIKAQIPGTSVAELLQLYKQELQDQSVSKIELDDNFLTFSNDTFRFTLNRSDKFANFTSGQIKIEDNGPEYIVTLEADNSRTYTVAGIVSAAITLVWLISSNFDLSVLIMGLIIFVLISGIGYGTSTISVPVYFEGVRNDIERRIQSKEITYGQ